MTQIIFNDVPILINKYYTKKCIVIHSNDFEILDNIFDKFSSMSNIPKEYFRIKYNNKFYSFNNYKDCNVIQIFGNDNFYIANIELYT